MSSSARSRCALIFLRPRSGREKPSVLRGPRVAVACAIGWNHDSRLSGKDPIRRVGVGWMSGYLPPAGSCFGMVQIPALRLPPSPRHSRDYACVARSSRLGLFALPKRTRKKTIGWKSGFGTSREPRTPPPPEQCPDPAGRGLQRTAHRVETRYRVAACLASSPCGVKDVFSLFVIIIFVGPMKLKAID